MITRHEYRRAQQRAADMIRQAGIPMTDAESKRVEVVDFGLGHLAREGVQVFTFFATERLSAKVLVLFPGQTEPEHWHPPVGSDPGKEEVVRVVAGTVHFYIPGEGEVTAGWIPPGKESVYTSRREVVLKPCDQLIVPPGTKHWFQAPMGGGAVMYSFSTCARDALDQFSDPGVVRQTHVAEDS
jgi:D-lyxose ketol-isomerase